MQSLNNHTSVNSFEKKTTIISKTTLYTLVKTTVPIKNYKGSKTNYMQTLFCPLPYIEISAWKWSSSEQMSCCFFKSSWDEKILCKLWYTLYTVLFMIKQKNKFQPAFYCENLKESFYWNNKNLFRSATAPTSNRLLGYLQMLFFIL